MTDSKNTLVLPLTVNIKRELRTPSPLEKKHSVVNNESTIPSKSSSEILTELFGVFNAEPPVITTSTNKKDSEESLFSKKSKKKHKSRDKKKKKKIKKRGRSSSNDSCKEDSRKKKSKKKHKRKRQSSSDESDSESNILKKSKRKDELLEKSYSSENDLSITEKEIKNRKKLSLKKKHKNTVKDIEKEDPKLKVLHWKQTKLIRNDVEQEDVNSFKETITIEENNIESFQKHFNHVDLELLKNTEDILESKEEQKEKDLISPKPGKIMIKNLKYSSIYEATAKQFEEEAKKKAEMYDEGEISDTPPLESFSESDLISLSVNNVSERRKEGNKHGDKIREHKRDRDRHKHGRSNYRSHSRSRSRSRDKHSKDDSKTSKSTDKRKRSRSPNNKSYHSHREKSSRHHRSSGEYDYKDRRTDRSYNRHRHRSRSRSRGRSRSRDKERFAVTRTTIDKKRLLEIARKNAIHMLKSGTLPGAAGLGPQAQEKVLAAIKSGGKTIDELTDFCKNLSQKESLGELSSFSSAESEHDEDGVDKPFHHPFVIKDRGAIIMNIKNSIPLPVKTHQEKTAEQSKQLRILFPVSSGQQHRESEWVPVDPPTVPVPVNSAKPKGPLAILPAPPIPILNAPNKKSDLAPLQIEEEIIPVAPSLTSQYTSSYNANITVPLPVQPPMPLVDYPADDQVFDTSIENSEFDLGAIISQRLTAMRKLQENPTDAQAMHDIFMAQQNMSAWASSKYKPGQFTGSTGANILTAKELQAGTQAWAKKDQLQTAAPVSGGMGMHLLQKMGWRPGEGLGKDKTGSLQPLMLEVKLDKCGLVANDEVKNRAQNMKKINTVKSLSGKHPVSLLGEYASKRKLGAPQYELCFECGPDHKKNFLFKVRVNGVEYQPSVASANKKQAKADAATICLQQLGVLPKDS